MNHFGLEDVFVAGDASTDKLAWVTGWRKLPHLTRDTERLFDYPQQFAEDMFNRIEQALGLRVSDDEAKARARTGSLHVLPADDLQADRHIRSADERDRREGMFLVSYQTPAGWRAIDKATLTEVLGAGGDATIVGVPPAAVGVLKLMCPRLVVLPEH